MLHAVPQNLFSSSFTVNQNGKPIAEVDLAWFRERADVRIFNETFTFVRDGILSGTFALQFNGQVLATAHKSTPFTRAFDIETGGRILSLRAVSIWTREFRLFENGKQIGRIYPLSFWGRTTGIDLPQDLSIPVQTFLFWLVVVLWRRAANS